MTTYKVPELLRSMIKVVAMIRARILVVLTTLLCVSAFRSSVSSTRQPLGLSEPKRWRLLSRRVSHQYTQEQDLASSIANLSVVPTARRPSVESGLRYSSDDWLRNFLSIPNSFVLRRIRFHLAADILLCILAVVFHTLYPSHRAFSLPTTVHSMLGGFMSLLLVFRTNSAYSRFWEARGVWTKCMSTCRKLTLGVVNYLQPSAPKSSSRLLQLIQAYPDALCYTCVSGKMDKPIPSHMDSSSSSPLEPAMMLCHAMHTALHDAAMENPDSRMDFWEASHLSELSHDVNVLVDTLSSCEKIVKTPVPWSYSRHTSRFLTLWCGTLPLGLIKPLGSIPTLLVVAVASWCLLGIEEIGHLIEQPFQPLNGDPSEAKDETTDLQEPATTQPYDIGIPVFKCAKDVKDEVSNIIHYSKSNPVAHNQLI